MTPFEQQAFKLGLAQLLAPDGYFCISQFDTLLKMAGVTMTDRERLPFSALHCVHYREMSRAAKEELVARIAELLDRGPDPLRVIQDALREKPAPGVIERSWIQKLLNK